MDFIESTSNTQLKEVGGLITKPGLRKKSDVFVVEGQREIDLAMRSGFRLKKLFWCPQLWQESAFEHWVESQKIHANIIGLSEKAYRKVSYRSSTEGIIGLIYKKDFSLESLKPLDKNPLVLVVDHVLDEHLYLHGMQHSSIRPKYTKVKVPNWVESFVDHH